MGSELILHIGTHKTGTTALQAALSSNSKALSAAGYVYPPMPEKWPHVKQNRNAYWLSMAALQEIESSKARHIGKIPACLESFTEAVAREETVILSDERMWYCGTKAKYWRAVRRIVEQAGVSKTRIVVYLRRQDLFAESLWAQYVKGNTRLEQDLDAFLDKPKTFTVCDYAAGVRRLQSVFGAGNVVVRIYDKETLVGGDTVADFLSILGIDANKDAWRASGSANDSLSPSLAYLKLALNKTPQYQQASSNYLLPTLLDVSKRDEVKRGSFMTPQMRAAFLAQFDEGNAQIARELFGRDELFACREGELEREAFQPDAAKLADQAAQVIVEAVQCEERKHATEMSKLKARIDELEQRENSHITSKVKRLLKRIARRLTLRAHKEDTAR